MNYHEGKNMNYTQLPLDHGLPTSFQSSSHTRGTWKKKKKCRMDDEVSAAVQKLFSKKVKLENENFELPPWNTMFTEDSWIVEDLKKLKTNLNEIKSKLNDYNLTEWRVHTRKRSYSGEVVWRVRKEINPELLTQAWCKFYEILSFFDLISEESHRTKQLKSIHLCEAPGAFITALNHWLKSNEPSINWSWSATTLNPNYEGNSTSYMINDDRFILHTENNWYFGVDNTGNLMNLQNINSFSELEKKNRDKILLITADGSIDCLDVPDEQEKVVSHLHYCEVITALGLLGQHGNFVIKLFTIFECQTVCLIYLLSCCFNEIFIRKPATSREGNSEIYAVCLGFKGPDYVSPYLNILKEHIENYTDKAIFRKNDIPNSFIKQILSYGDFFMTHQCEVISNNIKTFKAQTDHSDMIIGKIRRNVAKHFIKICNLRKLWQEEMEVVKNRAIAQSFCYQLSNDRDHDSFNHRRIKDSMRAEERLKILSEHFQFINEINDTYKIQCMGDKPGQLKISTAIPYKSIQSSKFCPSKILKIYKLAYEIKEKSINNWYYPSDDAAIQAEYSNYDKDDKFIFFNYTAEYDGFNVIEKIHEEITNLKQSQTLVLIGYSLLTQFNVGILYFLAHTFEHIEMHVTQKLGCIITLRNYTPKDNIIECLNKILEASTTAKTNNKIILSVISILQLCECDLYSKILDINCLVIKYFVTLVEMIISTNKLS